MKSLPRDNAESSRRPHWYENPGPPPLGEIRTLGGDPIKSNDNGESRHARSRTIPAAVDGNASGFGEVTINFKPAPDAEGRLRRLFSLLLEHVATERHSAGAKEDTQPAKAGEGAGEG